MSLGEEEKESLANSAGLTLQFTESDFFCAFSLFLSRHNIKSPPPEISERMFSHMKHDMIPQKNALLAVIANAQSSPGETDEILRCGGYVLSDSIAFDRIVAWLLENVLDSEIKTTRTAYINEILENFGYPTLGTREKKSDN
jgi:hypothetical protein